ncbi:sterol carrier family protein [Jonesia quinghaiensis]|uniref:sterol carrier family protein n=1 Tax=Jonesia quinghaiensis TaxID=262806 RepID=UPI000416A8B2|nr:sterol carrier family protein [Jonesia quinghaiensis]
MPPRRKIDPVAGREAVRAWRAGATDRPTINTAVRFTLEELAAIAPGNSVEVRVPPAGATQCIEGPRHTRGTPPNTIEMKPATWLGLVTGTLAWETVLAEGLVSASGQRADLADYLPLQATRER